MMVRYHHFCFLAWACAAELKFVRWFELSCARCGSSFFNEMVSSHPCVFSVGEKIPILAAQRWLQTRRKTAEPTPEDLRAAQDMAFAQIEKEVRELNDREVSRGHGERFPGCPYVMVGGKLPYERLRAGGRPGAGPARVVFNLRTNSLDRVLSRFAPALYGSEHGCTAAGYDHCMKSTHATVDVAWLVAQMRENEDTLAMVRDEVLETAKRVGAPLLAVRYEDLLRDADAVFQAYVLPFLGLDAAPLRPVQGHVQAKPSEGHVKRTGNLTHADMIDNWADVAAAAAAAGLEDALVDEAFRDATGEVLVVNPPPGYKARGR
ncbi:hypothetical protein SO694_00111086 [Aureococcus anophagefferens]|uniref:Sulfotransferase n=1 Tax=Aureococcus anophagefferens TaxID=44056 RepID=A0ABR1FWS6_AURAN